MEILKHTVLSCDGVHHLAGKVYLPPSAPVGILHILHGMTEHIARYHRFMGDMAEAGYIVCGYDHLGHGYTANDPSELGYFAKREGWELLLRDVQVFSDSVRKAYGEDLPYALMGHSMGSFIARLAAERYVRPDQLIIMGTGGPNPIAGVGLGLIRLIKLFCGERHVSPLAEALAFGGYNKRFGEDAHPKAWLTNDADVREAYMNDPFCTFHFTASAMGDLICLTKNANRRAWFEALPSDMPVLLVSGADDPVGDYGRGVETVCRRLTEAGKTVTCRLYDGYRHEILNDACYDRVVQDVRDFLNLRV